jgi:hypothetical protein
VDAGAIGIVVNLFVQIFGVTAETEPSGVASSSCSRSTAYEQPARPGETAPRARTECDDTAKVEIKGGEKPASEE